jgi:hypothetical protein
VNDHTSPAEQLAEARATNQRLNYRAQQLEAELATYRRAVRQWEVSERGTYIPHSSLRAIGTCGVDALGTVRHLKHFDRVEQAEAAIERVHAVLLYAEQVAATSGPGPASAVQAVAERLAAAIAGPRPHADAPAVGGAPEPKVIRCDIAVMHRPHPAHDWTQRPDGPVRRCPGVAQAEEAGA